MDKTFGYYYMQVYDIAKKAAENWGGTWTLPTREQWQKLIDECDWKHVSQYSFNGHSMYGHIVSDKEDSSKFIFLPEAGCYSDFFAKVHNQYSMGYYWTSYEGCYLYTRPSEIVVKIGSSLRNGYSVRPVSE